MSFMSKDIGVDLGTSNVRVYVKGKGMVLCEPSVVAINKITDEVLAVGNSAKEMLGRTPDSIVAVKPLKDGVIADFESTRMLLGSFISRVVPKSLFSKPRLVISIPSGITDVEERAVKGVAYRSSARDVFLIEEVMAAAIGSGIKVERPEGSMIIDFGGGTTEIAVLSLGGIVVSKTTKVAGDKFDRDIVEYIKQQFNVIVGLTEAEEVKKQIGAATSAMAEEKMTIKGRNLSTGLPETVTVTTHDINMAISDSLNEIMRYIKLTLEETPPELAADVMEKGIVICGGLSLIKNMDRFINHETGIPVFIAEDPESAVIRGVGNALESMEVLKKTVKTSKKF